MPAAMKGGSVRERNPLLARLGGLLELALNRAVALDPAAAARLTALEGRRVGVEVRGANLAFAISVLEGRLRVGPHWESGPDVNLRATPASLVALAVRRNESSLLPPGKVDISGDAELARQMEKLLRDFRPDIEEAFARTFGDVLGVPLARGLQRAFAWTRESAQALAQDTAEFLRDERRDLIAPAEMEQFLDEVDDLRERSDRLEARVRRVLQTLGADRA